MRYSKLEFRPEIDGLRAIAVLLVVLNHADFHLVPGGHIGVDVFFVISGYLITRIILFEVMIKSFSLRAFYLRRARRILPALLFVLAICSPIAYWLMLPSELEDFGRASIGAVLFVSNFVLWKQGGYFDVDAALSPLLHLWSLAIEEQFYLLFPIVILVGAKLRRSALTILLYLSLAGSFMLLLLVYREMPRASFYLLPTRAWELLVGSVIGLAHFNGRRQELERKWVGLFPMIGLAIIIASALRVNESIAYPGPVTLWPVIGAAMIIGVPSSRSITFKLLSSKPFQLIGLASFSIYLWHQPLLVFARLVSADHLGRDERNFTVVLVVAAGVITWYGVERLTRSKDRVPAKLLLVGVAIVSIFVLAFNSILVSNNGFPDRLPPNVQWESTGQRPVEICSKDENWEERHGLAFCVFGDSAGSKNVFLVGDSHADSLLHELDIVLKDLGIRGVRVSLGGCSEIPGSYLIGNVPSDLNKCQAKFDSLLKEIKSNRATTILSLRWTFRLYPIPGQIEQLEATNSDGGHEVEDYREYVIADARGVSTSADHKIASVQKLLDGLITSSESVIVVGPVPEIAWNIARINLTYFRTHGKILDSLSIPESDYELRNQFILGVMKDYESRKIGKLQVVYPSSQLCSTYLEARCVAQVDGIPLYLDDDHLSDNGARLVVKAFEFSSPEPRNKGDS